MNYQKIYLNLIRQARNRIDDLDYFEIHHIIPKSQNGTDDHENLVKLSFREHYLAHWLLYKLASSQEEKYKMSCAFFIMSKSNNGLRITSSRLYDRAKRLFKKEYSKFLSSEVGQNSLKERAKKRVAKQQKDFVFHFYHDKFGDFEISTNDLKNSFPEQNLNSSNLVKVGKGERPSHKGWILYSNKNIGVKGFLEDKKLKMSSSAKQKFANNDYAQEHREFSAKGGQAQRGFKRHYHANNKPIKALPGSEKSQSLIMQGYYLK